MKNLAIIFLISAAVGLAGGYAFFQLTGKSDTVATNQETASVKKETTASTQQQESTSAKETASAKEGGILKQKGCLSCHSVSKLNLQGGTTGPDLSNAYKEVEGKHGKPIDEFLKTPTSAVMSGVIEGTPLTDEERSAIIEVLKTASEK
jgi:cytochrome c551/c552